jgi:hypothetical protein
MDMLDPRGVAPDDEVAIALIPDDIMAVAI